MKKTVALLIAVCLVSALSGCGGSSGHDSGQNAVEDILNQAVTTAAEETTAELTLAARESKEIPALNFSADVDLTELNSTMVYSEVYNMVNTPEDYKGKTVKATGTFSVYVDPNSGKYYYACLIADAAACCSQGLEFELKGDYNYPDDYPAQGSVITVAGEFDTYSEGDGSTYCTLRNAELAF